MSDMQTALTKALEEGKRRFLTTTVQEWDTHEQTIRQPQEKAMKYTHTGVLTHDVFAVIKDNPSDLTPSTAAKFLESKGYKRSSIHAIITQMKRNGTVMLNSDGRLYTKTTEYKPVVNPYSVTKKSLKEKAKAWAGIAALQPDTTPKKEPVKMTAKGVLEQLNVAEAYALYAELSKMFGGVK